MDLVLGGTRLKMGTDGSRRWGLLATRLSQCWVFGISG
jgi:hypothetical protein